MPRFAPFVAVLAVAVAAKANQAHLSGAIRYALGGTPMNLAEIRSFGAGCGGLGLAGSGGAGLGQTVTLTTTPAVPAGLAFSFPVPNNPASSGWVLW